MSLDAEKEKKEWCEKYENANQEKEQWMGKFFLMKNRLIIILVISLVMISMLTLFIIGIIIIL
jgi:hypothetical protein